MPFLRGIPYMLFECYNLHCQKINTHSEHIRMSHVPKALNRFPLKIAAKTMVSSSRSSSTHPKTLIPSFPMVLSTRLTTCFPFDSHVVSHQNWVVFFPKFRRVRSTRLYNKWNAAAAGASATVATPCCWPCGRGPGRRCRA